MDCLLDNSIESKIWQEHTKGKSISEISESLKVQDEFARAVITQHWLQDKMRHKH